MSRFSRNGRRGVESGGHHGGGQPAVELLGERYRLVERLGTGGMSVVWRGYDEVLGRQVAVKVLASRLASDRAFRHRIRVEAKAAARLCHPNITGVYDYGEAIEGGVTVPYVVMELVDGEPLQARLARAGALPWQSAVTVCAEVASALATAHARGVVHRDVTPGNVMLTSTGAKVVDFGISALIGESDAGPDGSLLGTPGYLAPERLDGGPVSPATDVYALGVLLYKTLTGRSPYRASTTPEMLRAHLYSDPEPMPSLPDLPDDVVELCRRCLAKPATERPTSVEVARALAGAAGVNALVPVSPAPGIGGETPDLTELSDAGTTILPGTTTVTGALPVSLSGRSLSLNGRRWAGRSPLEIAAVSVGLLTVTGLVWAGSGKSSGQPEVTAGRPGLEMPSPATCEVDYALRKDTGREFDAELTVRNTGDQAQRDWWLRFAFPADQRLTDSGEASYEQEIRDVVIRPVAGASLNPGSATQVKLSGTYTEANPLPVEFRLGDASCRVRVSGVSMPAAVAPQPVRADQVGASRGIAGSGGKATKGGKGGKGKH